MVVVPVDDLQVGWTGVKLSGETAVALSDRGGDKLARRIVEVSRLEHAHRRTSHRVSPAVAQPTTNHQFLGRAYGGEPDLSLAVI
jgi:hypothetical protein